MNGIGKEEVKRECAAKGNADVREDELFKKAEEYIMDGLYEAQEIIQKRQHILDEINAMGMSPESCWKKIAEDTGKDTRWRQSKADLDALNKIKDSDKPPKEKLSDFLDYLVSSSSQKKIDEIIKRKTKSKFGNHWGQYNYKSTVTLEKVAVKNGLAAAIFLYLARKSDKYNKATCSYKDMMTEFGVSERSISRAISLLEENRLVSVHKSGSSNYYIVSHYVTWKGEAWRYDCCEFDGQEINKRNEQRKIRSEKAKERAAKKKTSEEKNAEESNTGEKVCEKETEEMT